MPGRGLLPLQQSVAIMFTVGILSGLYVAIVGFANRWLLFSDEGWRLKRQIHWLMVVMTNVLATLILTDTALTVRIPMGQSSFVDSGHRPEEWINIPGNAIVGGLLANLVALLADIVMMYRLWAVYNKKLWIICFPVFLWLSGVVCTALQVFLQVVHIRNPKFGPYQWRISVNMVVGPGIVLSPFWAANITLNGYCIGLLIWQIRRASKRSGDNSTTRSLRFLIRILMESGALYLSISLAYFLVWFGNNDFAIYMLGAINTSVIGIAFNLILIRTAQNKMKDEGTCNSKITEIIFNSQQMVSIEAHSSVDTHPAADGHPDSDETLNFSENPSKSSA